MVIFAGQDGYGYRSIEDFVKAAAMIREGSAVPADFRSKFATIDDTVWVTAVLEAGRRSLDAGGSVVRLRYDDRNIVEYV